MLLSLCGSSPFLIWIEVARSCVSAQGARIEYQAVQTRYQGQQHLHRHLRRRLLCARHLLCVATGDVRYENLKKRTRLTVSKTWTTGLFRAFAARVELATCRFSVRTTGGRFGVLSAERRGGPPTGPICTTGLKVILVQWSPIYPSPSRTGVMRYPAIVRPWARIWHLGSYL
jgi:hypothetical protein